MREDAQIKREIQRISERTYRERKWLGNIDSKKETRKEIGLENEKVIQGKMIKIERNIEKDIEKYDMID